MQICITDAKKNKCLVLEDFVFQPKNHNELMGILQKIFEEHAVVMAGFWNSVKLSFKNEKFTLIPAPLFIKEQAQEYLRMNCEFNLNKEELSYYKHISCDAYNLHAVDKKILNWIRDTYPNLKVHVIHQSSSIIEGILQNYDKSPEKAMFLVIENSVLHIAVAFNKSLIYYNQFRYKSTNDVVKYTLLAMKELGLDQNSTKVLMWGDIDSTSEEFKELYKYIRHISFGNKPKYLQFGYLFDDLEDHQYFDVYSMYLCE
jgi:hypothetical protein